ncbi:hypothetical protein O0L34_g16157 [Tuta absoluta]|nr:hypothetical protein O0L34_g16157 [Tuta absoluta]
MDTNMCENESEADVKPFVDKKPASYKESESELFHNEEKRRKIKFDPEGMFYDMTGEKYLVIFNHFKYDRESLAYYRNPPSYRNGTDEDVHALEKTFKKLGFHIDVHDDFNREKIWETFLELRRKDFSSASCLCIAILTHGSSKGELNAYDEPYNLKDVTKLLESHPTLAGKPKLFFIQACRGKMADDGNRIAIDGDDKRFIVAPSHADFLIVRSTVEDYISYRDNRGSWLIQELCKAIQAHHETLDILHIITVVNQKIALGYETYAPRNPEIHKKRQNPETTFTLTKILKFPSAQSDKIDIDDFDDKTSDQSKSIRDEKENIDRCSIY